MGLVKETGIDQVSPAVADLLTELVLKTGVDRIFQRLMRKQQGVDTRALESDPAFQADRDVPGINVPAYAPGAQPVVKRFEYVRPGHRLPVDADRNAPLECQAELHRTRRPVLPAGRHCPGVLRRRLVVVDFTPGNRHSEQVGIDRIPAGGILHLDPGLRHDLQFVVPDALDPGLKVADRRMDLILTQAVYSLVETKLVVAHAGTTVGEMPGPKLIAQLQAAPHDQVTVRTQQGILAPHPGMAPNQRPDEFVPDGLRYVDLMVFCCAQAHGAFTNFGPTRIIHAARIDESGMHLVTLLGQVENAIAGVQTSGECQYDFCVHCRSNSI